MYGVWLGFRHPVEMIEGGDRQLCRVKRAGRRCGADWQHCRTSLNANENPGWLAGGLDSQVSKSRTWGAQLDNDAVGP